MNDVIFFKLVLTVIIVHFAFFWDHSTIGISNIRSFMVIVFSISHPLRIRSVFLNTKIYSKISLLIFFVLVFFYI